LWTQIVRLSRKAYGHYRTGDSLRSSPIILEVGLLADAECRNENIRQCLRAKSRGHSSAEYTLEYTKRLCRPRASLHWVTDPDVKGTSVFIGPVIRALAHDERSSLRVVLSDPRSEVGFHRILHAAQLFVVARQSAGLAANTVFSIAGVCAVGRCFVQPGGLEAFRTTEWAFEPDGLNVSQSNLRFGLSPDQR
jgi:hypothetical protein